MVEKNITPESEDKAENMPDTEQPVADSQTEAQAETDTAAPRKKRRLGPWLFLLLVFVGLPVAWLLSPPEIHRQVQDTLDKITSQIRPIQQKAIHSTSQDSMMPHAEPTASAPKQAHVIALEEAQAEADVTVAPPALPLTPEKSVTSGSTDMVIPPAPQETQTETNATSDASELDNMREGIKRLQSGLSIALAERDALHTQLLASRQRELSNRLHWISRPETRLLQRAELWNEIVLLPELSEEDRDRAKMMVKLADDHRALIETWRKTLSQLAERIPDARQADILPKPDNPYLAWLIGTFHLRPAPGNSDLMQISLRRQLMHMEHAFSREDWPAQAEWKTLIANLHEQFGADADLGLPESLQPTLREMDILRETANSWLETL